jgi:predicted acyl esterase
MRFVRVLCAVAVLCLGLTAAPSPSVAQSAEDPLVGDSLAALAQLVSKDGGACTLKDAADGDPATGPSLPFVLCDDGLPPSGGGEKGIPVPVKYAANASGDDWTGLPDPAPQEEVDSADAEEDLQPEEGNRITLDVDITLPPSKKVLTELGLDAPKIARPENGHPVIVLMHGCCGGNKNSWEAATVDAEREHWHHSNAWWASRGYVVITYTARGFRNANDEGSTGTTQLDSRRYEVNDYQYLVGLLADHDAARRAEGLAPLFDINPRKIGAVGGSYGGGFAWLAVTDPTWKSPAAKVRVKLAAATPKYGWTDLVESLVPSGHYEDWKKTASGGLKSSIAPTDPAKALSRTPIGVEKQSIVAGLYATGNLQSGNHTTFPAYMHDTYARLQLGEPYEGDAIVEPVLESFLADRSAYFQNAFWSRVTKGYKVPIFAAGTQTDPLFPAIETLRFYNKLKKLNRDYPISLYMGDYQHFVQNKAKEWGDLCGDDHHVCKLEDAASIRVHTGINTRINKFLDHYLLARGKRPPAKAIATTTVCPANSTEALPADEPGIEYRAPSWRAMAPKLMVLGWSGGGAVSSGAMDAHAPDSDPVFRDRQTDKCHTLDSTPPGAGVVQYTSEPLAEAFTMMGMPQVNLGYSVTFSGDEYWIAARLYDKDPEGQMTQVTRGLCKVNVVSQPERLCESFQLFGNGWRFEKDHSVVMEITQADTPFLRKQNEPSALSLAEANITIPVALEKYRKDFRD